MKIKDLHKDIERYLLNDCYCPHEVYSFDGFFYQLFYEDQECEKLGENKNDTQFRNVLKYYNISENKFIEYLEGKNENCLLDC